MSYASEFSALGIQMRGNEHGEQKKKCPQCSHLRRPQNRNEPCLSINLDTGVYNCHNCDFQGTVAKTEWSPNYTKQEVRPKKDYRLPTPKPPASLSAKEKVFQWFATERKINSEVLEYAKVTVETSVFFPSAQVKKTAMAFNYYDKDGQLRYVKYRDSEKNFTSSPGAEPILYLEHLLYTKGEGGETTTAEDFVITEGEIDALSVVQSGFVAVSIPNGAGNKQLDWLERISDVILNAKNVILATDADEKGLEMRELLADRIGRHRCSYVEYPPDCKDFNEVLKNHGEGKVLQVVVNPKRFPVKGIVTLEENSKLIYDLYANGMVKGRPIGMSEMDKAFRPAPGEVTMITGIPGHGKSNLVEFLNVMHATEYGVKTAFYSPEHTTALNYMRLMKKYIGKQMWKEVKGEPVASRTELDMAMRFINHHFIEVRPDGYKTMNIEQLIEKFEILVMQYGVKHIVIDAWNKVKKDKGASEEDGEFVERVLNTLCLFAEATGTHIFLVAHPRKMKEDAQGFFDMPSLYDISGSAHFYNTPHNGLIVYRLYNGQDLKSQGDVIVRVQKIKHRHNGKKSDVFMYFDEKSDRYFGSHGERDLFGKTHLVIRDGVFR